MKLGNGSLGWLVAGWIALPVWACSHALPPPPDVAADAKTDYLIGPSDELTITVWKNQELSARVPVRPDGKISVPLVDDVQAAGLTTRELKEILTRSLGEYVSAPDVTVVVTEINSQRVYVVGEVGRPTPIVLNTEMRVLDAIAQAGGFTTFANKGNVKILRRNGDGIDEYRFDYNAFVKGRSPGANFQLRHGDTIVVSD